MSALDALWIGTFLKVVGSFAIAAFINYVLEHVLNRRLLSGIYYYFKKEIYKRTRAVDAVFTFRIDFPKKLESDRLKVIIKEYVNNLEKGIHWNKNEISFEIKNSCTHRFKIKLIQNYLEDDLTKSEGILVSIKTDFKLGDLKDCLISISSLSDKLVKHLTKTYNLPFLVNNSEFEIWNPEAEFDIPLWLRKEGLKLSIVAEAANDLNLQIYLDHARIETTGITFEPKISKYLEEIFINYYVGKNCNGKAH
jgi:hypothetical protein